MLAYPPVIREVNRFSIFSRDNKGILTTLCVLIGRKCSCHILTTHLGKEKKDVIETNQFCATCTHQELTLGQTVQVKGLVYSPTVTTVTASKDNGYTLTDCSGMSHHYLNILHLSLPNTTFEKI